MAKIMFIGAGKVEFTKNVLPHAPTLAKFRARGISGMILLS